MSAEFHTTDSIGDNTKGQQSFSTFLKFFCIFWFLLASFVGFSDGVYLNGILNLVAAIAYFLFIHKLVWKISNAIRLWVMPTDYVVADATDAFKKKIFWNIGPQFFGSIFVVLVMVLVIDQVSPVIGITTSADKQIKERNKEKREKDFAQTPKIEEKFIVPEKFQGKWFIEGFFSKVKCDSNPLIIDSEKLTQGSITNILLNDSGNLVSKGGDSLVYVDEQTLKVTYKTDSSVVIFKKCPN